MARRRQKDEQAPNAGPAEHVRPPHGGQGLALATLAGVVGLLMISFSNWREIDRIEESLSDRLGKIENRISQVSAKVDKIPSRTAAQPARKGPDPNRVYNIKTAGAPAKGPASAAVTIAEFSDFQ